MNRPDHGTRASLAAVIEHDVGAVRQLEAALHPLTAEAGYSECAGVAYALHNLYCALENSFDQVSRSFENHVVHRDQWDRELLLKMFLEIPGVRPAVLPLRLRPLLNELRSFRHVFRHSYEFRLDPVLLSALVAAWQAESQAVLQALEESAAWLRGEKRPGSVSENGAQPVPDGGGTASKTSSA
jgi:hypothetical protein